MLEVTKIQYKKILELIYLNIIIHMKVFDYYNHPEIIVSQVPQIIDKLFDKETLVIYDIRSSIFPSVLPSIPYVATYDQRIISLLNHSTLICSEPFNNQIIELYRSMGLQAGNDIISIPHQSNQSLTEQILQDEQLCKSLQEKNFTNLIVFLPTPATVLLSKKLQIPLLNTYEISQQANDKVALKKFLQESWLPTIDWIITNDHEIISSYISNTDNHFIKISHGVSWFGLFDTKDDIDLTTIINSSEWKEVIIEKKIIVDSSPSMQIYCDDSDGYLIGLTDQILDQWRYYLGNSYPSVYHNHPLTEEILAQSRTLITYLHSIWFRGFAGIDFMISDTNVYVAEINARFTWATPSTIVSILIHWNLTKSRKFVSYDWSLFKIDKVVQSSSANTMMPINIWGLEKWWKIQLLERF